MSFQTVGRNAPQKYEEPITRRAGLPIIAQYYNNQIIVQDGSQANGPFRPYVQGLTGSVIVGLATTEDFNVTAAAPLPEVFLEVVQGTFAFANDSASSGSVGATTLENTLLWAVDDQTVSTLAGGTGLRLPVGRLALYDTTNASYPVFVRSVGTIPSGTLV